MSRLLQVYEQLFKAYGPQFWWPGETPFEVMVGAILTQNTSWKNVELALSNLRSVDALSVPAMCELPATELAELIRPAGYYRLKARRLSNLISFIVERFEGSVDRLFQQHADELRQQLLSINGIGPETADSILLYAAQLPTFVVDTYTARVVKRHAWIDLDADYHQIKSYFEAELELDAPLFNEFHALIVQVGKRHCRKVPDCKACPLRDLLPPDGAVAEY